MWTAFAACFVSAAAYNRQQQFVQVLVDSSAHSGSSRLVRSEMLQIPSLLADPKPIQVRFSLLQPSNDTESLLNTQVPFLQNSLCWAEKNLASALMASQFGHPEYVVYTDNHTHSYAQEIFRRLPWNRYDLVNLDLDPRDAQRLQPFRRQRKDFDDKNWASVRRTLADCDHLSTSKGRLLLGTDVKFLRRPEDFVAMADQLQDQQAIYMVDRFWQGETADGQPVTNVKYRMNSSGPQCPGLLGDFVYLSPHTSLSVSQLQSKMRWYMDQPRTLSRTIPPCPSSCMASNGLHAIDQFALVLALGEAVRPSGQGCFSLDVEKYSHWYPRTPKTQVTHDKTMDACIMEVDPTEEEAQLKILFAAIVLLFTAVLSLLCAFTEEKGNEDLNDWRNMCTS